MDHGANLGQFKTGIFKAPKEVVFYRGLLGTGVEPASAINGGDFKSTPPLERCVTQPNNCIDENNTSFLFHLRKCFHKL